VLQAATAIKALPPGTVVTVTGVADTLGPQADNVRLAYQRALTVIEALRDAGATNVTYLSRRTLEPPTPGDPEASRRADIDWP